MALNKKMTCPPPSENELRIGNLDALIERCLNDISEHPAHPLPRLYLARAYYKKAMWKEAEEQFEIVAGLEPSWKTESIDPYLRAIETWRPADERETD